MNWHSVLQRINEAAELKEGSELDPFQRLCVIEDNGARVSMTVGRAITYGEIKCSATVTLNCPQREACIDLAAEMAYSKALELVNDGMSQFGLPRLGEEE